MKDLPILFSAPMVRAILEGRKTQTRRVITPAWLRCLDLDDFHDADEAARQSPFQLGRRMWVRETWYCDHCFVGDVDLTGGSDEEARAEWRGMLYFRADSPRTGTLHEQMGEMGDSEGNPWRPSIHMPRWASRITLLVTSMHIERLQSITEEHARAEGVASVAEYRALWDGLNAGRGFGWDANPWVWAVSFGRLDDTDELMVTT